MKDMCINMVLLQIQLCIIHSDKNCLVLLHQKETWGQLGHGSTRENGSFLGRLQWFCIYHLLLMLHFIFGPQMRFLKWMQELVSTTFFRHGMFCAKHPEVMILLSAIMVIFCWWEKRLYVSVFTGQQKCIPQ